MRVSARERPRVSKTVRELSVINPVTPSAIVMIFAPSVVMLTCVLVLSPRHPAIRSVFCKGVTAEEGIWGGVGGEGLTFVFAVLAEYGFLALAVGAVSELKRRKDNYSLVRGCAGGPVPVFDQEEEVIVSPG